MGGRPTRFSYVFTRYYGGNKQRRYVKHAKGDWYYSERTMKYKYGHRDGWTFWTDWQKETQPVIWINDDTIQTPIGEAYRTEETIYRIKTT